MTDESTPFIERRISVLESSHHYLKGSMETVVEKLDQILEQSTKIAILSEKQATHQLDLDRAALRIEKIENKHTELSKQVSDFISFITGLTKLAYILWTTLGGLTFVLLIKILFFLGRNGFAP